MICDYKTLIDIIGDPKPNSLNGLRVENAVIVSMDIFIEDHGILTSFVDVKVSDGQQGYGGYRLEKEYLAKWVRGILEVTNKDKIERLKEVPVRVVLKNGLIKAICNYLEDKWYYHE